MALTTSPKKVGVKLAKTLAKGIMDFFIECGKPGNKADFSKLSQFFSPTVLVVSNENQVSKNLQEFQNRIKNIQTRFPTITYTKFLEKPIIARNKVVIRYNLETMDTQGKKREVVVIAILTVENDKVVQWTEVLHEKGLGEIDS